jgi:hypothetical protein
MAEGGATMKLPTVTLMDGDGRYVWTGTLTQFARDLELERERAELIAALGNIVARSESESDLGPITHGSAVMAAARAVLSRVQP